MIFNRYRYYNKWEETIKVVDKDFYVTPHFKASELACKGSGVLRFNPDFLCHLKILRESVALKMYPTSCCRSPEYNKGVGGHPRSLHLTENNYHPTGGTMAIDIATHHYTLEELNIIFMKALDLGWSVGENTIINEEGKIVEGSFYHLDRRTDIGLPQKNFTY